MNKKKRQLRDWVWIMLAMLTFVGAIFLSGLIEKWL